MCHRLQPPIPNRRGPQKARFVDTQKHILYSHDAFKALTAAGGFTLIIKSIEVRVCQNRREAMTDGEMRAGGKSDFDFLVISMKTDTGVEGHSFGFAGRGAEMAGSIAAS